MFGRCIHMGVIPSAEINLDNENSIRRYREDIRGMTHDQLTDKLLCFSIKSILKSLRLLSESEYGRIKCDELFNLLLTVLNRVALNKKADVVEYALGKNIHQILKKYLDFYKKLKERQPSSGTNQST